MSVLASAQANYHRHLLVVSGEREWSRQFIQSVVQPENFSETLWITDAEINQPVVSATQAHHLLGRQVDCVIFDAWAGLHPDALAVVAGLIKGGGVLFLMTPPLHEWEDYADPDYQRMLVHAYSSEQVAGRFIRHIINSFESDQITVLDQRTSPVIHQHLSSSAAQPPTQIINDIYATEDQQLAVNAVIKVLTGHSRRPLVMTADRGRGKSAALGIACAKIMSSGCYRIILTAPNRDAVNTVFEHCAKVLTLDPSNDHVNTMTFGDASLQFVPADEIIRLQLSADLLLIDEAAALPVPILEKLVSRHNRCVFSTTVHGYEGTGRGFEIRFKNILEQLTPQWRSVELSQPVRWAEGDPLERWLFKVLLLNTTTVPAESIQDVLPSQCITEELNRDELVRDNRLLNELFGLLVVAHYQTSPSDLRSLLDGPNIRVWCSRYQGHIVAAAIIAAEGGMDDQLADAITRGERRPRGHLLPQTLASHCGFNRAPILRYQRVIRIAVHPSLVRRGFGAQLFNTIIAQARREHYDFVGSSFAATADVLAFWNSLQCIPVRLGVRRDANSGCHSVMVLSALSIEADSVLTSVCKRFTEHFYRGLENIFKDLDAELVIMLLDSLPIGDESMNNQDWKDIMYFAEGRRQFEVTHIPLWQFVCCMLTQERHRKRLSFIQQSLLVKRVLQYQSVSVISEHFGFTGKKQVLSELRSAIKTLYESAKSANAQVGDQ